MRDRSVPWVIPIFLTLLMLGMSASFFVKPPQSASLQDNPTHYVGLNQPTNLEISTPNGSSSALKAEVPVGHTVESIDLALAPDVVAYNDGFT